MGNDRRRYSGCNWYSDLVVQKIKVGLLKLIIIIIYMMALIAKRFGYSKND